MKAHFSILNTPYTAKGTSKVFQSPFPIAILPYHAGLTWFFAFGESCFSCFN